MSQWTHVNASFRLNSIGKIPDEKIIDIFGKQVDYRSMSSIEYDENYEVKIKINIFQWDQKEHWK